MIETNSKIMHIGTILSFGDLTSVKTTLTLQHLYHELIVLLIYYQVNILGGITELFRPGKP